MSVVKNTHLPFDRVSGVRTVFPVPVPCPTGGVLDEMRDRDESHRPPRTSVGRSSVVPGSSGGGPVEDCVGGGHRITPQEE